MVMQTVGEVGTRNENYRSAGTVGISYSARDGVCHTAAGSGQPPQPFVRKAVDR